MELEEIWRHAGEIENRMRRRAPNGLPYPRLLVAQGLGTLTGADFSKPPPGRDAVRRLLELLLGRASDTFDIASQAEIVELLSELD